MDLVTFLIALNVALGLGLLIGVERQLGQHPAGLRTNALVCGGAALFVLVARSLVQGSDVWLNTPRRPEEASGTSGMKAMANGCLNLSVLDGWWMEAYDGTNGWAIDGGVDPDEAAKDERDAYALYDLLEHEVKPLYYDRDARGVPTGWLERVRASLRSLGPKYCATRMLDDYVAHVYRT